MSSHVVVVELTVDAGMLAGFLPLLRANAAASLRDEPGCRQFDICHDPARPEAILLYEVYDDAAAFAAQLASAHYLDFDKATSGMIKQKSVRRLTRDD